MIQWNTVRHMAAPNPFQRLFVLLLAGTLLATLIAFVHVTQRSGKIHARQGVKLNLSSGLPENKDVVERVINGSSKPIQDLHIAKNTPDTTQDPLSANNILDTAEDPYTITNIPNTIQDPYTTTNIPDTIQDPTLSNSIADTTKDPYVPTKIPDRTGDPYTITNIPDTIQNPTLSNNIPDTTQNPYITTETHDTAEDQTSSNNSPRTFPSSLRHFIPQSCEFDDYLKVRDTKFPK